jgi:hypothetical protein
MKALEKAEKKGGEAKIRLLLITVRRRPVDDCRRDRRLLKEAS